jgi:CHAT domain-containing protein
MLHLATHGFFLPESGWGRAAKERSNLRGLGDEVRVDVGQWRLENPMHRSGLALAGANRTLAGKAQAGQEDGILTAEEVAGLDLTGTELVVLSACETGVGAARCGEGVLGLRRAFVQAGSANLVMALWKVEEKATQGLMGRFYESQLKGEPVWQALWQVQRDYVAAERKAGREPNPFYWAAFVASVVGVEKGK